MTSIEVVGRLDSVRFRKHNRQMLHGILASRPFSLPSSRRCTIFRNELAKQFACLLYLFEKSPTVAVRWPVLSSSFGRCSESVDDLHKTLGTQPIRAIRDI